MEYIYLLFKALHIVGFVAWFGGLFYLVRIFVYHVEAFDAPSGESQVLIKQYELMESRVYRIICNPGMMITWSFGIAMLVYQGGEWLGGQPWMHVKLLLLVALTIYHLSCKKNMKALAKEKRPMTSFQYRLYNEVPTLFLLAIVLLAVFKNIANFAYIFLGVVGFGIVIYLIARAYKNRRETVQNK